MLANTEERNDIVRHHTVQAETRRPWNLLHQAHRPFSKRQLFVAFGQAAMLRSNVQILQGLEMLDSKLHQLLQIFEGTHVALPILPSSDPTCLPD